MSEELAKKRETVTGKNVEEVEMNVSFIKGPSTLEIPMRYRISKMVAHIPLQVCAEIKLNINN